MQTVETLNEGLKRAYRITIPAKDIDARVDGELKKVAPQVRMPGFRPGKVPPNLVRKMHGAALEQEALQQAVQDGVQQLLAEQRLRPAMQPVGRARAKAATRARTRWSRSSSRRCPTCPRPKIEGLKLERLRVEPTDAEVDRRGWRCASPRARRASIPRPPAMQRGMGDLVVIDLKARSTARRSTAARASGMRSSSARAG